MAKEPQILKFKPINLPDKTKTEGEQQQVVEVNQPETGDVTTGFYPSDENADTSQVPKGITTKNDVLTRPFWDNVITPAIKNAPLDEKLQPAKEKPIENKTLGTGDMRDWMHPDANILAQPKTVFFGNMPEVPVSAPKVPIDQKLKGDVATQQEYDLAQQQGIIKPPYGIGRSPEEIQRQQYAQTRLNLMGEVEGRVKAGYQNMAQGVYDGLKNLYEASKETNKARQLGKIAVGGVEVALNSLPAIEAFNFMLPTVDESVKALAPKLGIDPKLASDVVQRVLPFAFGKWVGAGSITSEGADWAIDKMGILKGLDKKDEKLTRELIKNAIFFSMATPQIRGVIGDAVKSLHKSIKDRFDVETMDVPQFMPSGEGLTGVNRYEKVFGRPLTEKEARVIKKLEALADPKRNPDVNERKVASEKLQKLEKNAGVMDIDLYKEMFPEEFKTEPVKPAEPLKTPVVEEKPKITETKKETKQRLEGQAPEEEKPIEVNRQELYDLLKKSNGETEAGKLAVGLTTDEARFVLTGGRQGTTVTQERVDSILKPSKETKNASSIEGAERGNGNRGTSPGPVIPEEQRPIKDEEGGPSQVRINEGKGTTKEEEIPGQKTGSQKENAVLPENEVKLKERITDAAYKTPDGKILKGTSHPTIGAENKVPKNSEAGFYTSEDRFVSREQASKIAKQSGQISENAPKEIDAYQFSPYGIKEVKPKEVSVETPKVNQPTEEKTPSTEEGVKPVEAGQAVEEGKSEKLKELENQLADYKERKKLFAPDKGLGIDNAKNYDRLIKETEDEIAELKKKSVVEGQEVNKPPETPVKQPEVPVKQEITPEEDTIKAKALDLIKAGKKDSEILTSLAMDKNRDNLGKIKQWRKEVGKPAVSEKLPVRDIPVNDIKVDTKLFQNREKAFAQDTYDSIVNDVKEGKFNWGRFDAIKVWRNPKDNELYTLNHSRLKAFQDLAALGHKDFETIPATEFKGTLEEAQKFAKEESNVMGARESDLERAKIYRSDREAGNPKKAILEKAKKLEKRNAGYIINLSYLNPDGKTIAQLKSFEKSGSKQDLKAVEAIADWVGEAKQRYPELTNGHEDEIYDWLMDGGYEKIRNKTNFLDRINNVVSNVAFDAKQPLNLKNRVTKGYNQSNIESQLNEKLNEIKELEKERDDPRTPVTESRLKQITDGIAILHRELVKLKQDLNGAKIADQAQGDMFGDIGEAVSEGDISNDRKEEIIQGTNPAELEKSAQDIERKAESDKEAELTQAVKEANELIKPDIGEIPRQPIDEQKNLDAIERLKGKFKKPPLIKEEGAEFGLPQYGGEFEGEEPKIPIDELKDLVTVGAYIYQQGITKRFDWKQKLLETIGTIEDWKLNQVYDKVEERYGQQIENIQDIEEGGPTANTPGSNVPGLPGGAGLQPGERPSLVTISAEAIPKPTSYVSIDRYANIPDEYQVLAADLALTQFLDKKGRAFLLADGTGVGKTISILVTANEFLEKTGEPVLIISKSRTILLNNFADDANLIKVDMDKFDFGTYTDLANGKILPKDYGLVVFDESQELKNLTAEKTQASLDIKAKHKLFASATPTDKPTGAAYFFAEITGKHENEIARQLGYEISFEWDQKAQKERKFTHLLEGHNWNDVIDNIVKLRDEAIKGGAMIRREFPFYGEVKFFNANLDDEFRDRAEEAYWWFEDKIDRAKSMTAKRNWSGQRTLALASFTESKKADKIFELMQEDLKKGKTVVIIAENVGKKTNPRLKGTGKEIDIDKFGNKFPYHPYNAFIKQLEDKLTDAGIEWAQIYDATTGKKANEVRKFQKGMYKVAIATPKSGGTGINLDDQIGDRPTVVYIASLNFAGDVYEQILGRFSRKNTKSPVLVKVIVSTDSFSDNRKYNTLKKKMQTLRRIQSGEDPDKAIGIDLGSDLGGEELPPEIREQRVKFGIGSDQKVVPPFFSKMQKVLDEKLPDSFMPSQLRNIIDSGEIKKSEVEWSGIKEWLRSKEGKVTKQELNDFLKANELKVEEVKKGEQTQREDYMVDGIFTDSFNNLPETEKKFIKSQLKDFEVLNKEIDNIENLYAGSDQYAIKQSLNEHDYTFETDANGKPANLYKQGGRTGTKYSQYTLPGGENYRELLFTMPPTTRRSYYEKTGILEAYGEAKKHDFKSPHWDEPNVLAHTRVDDRIIRSPKVDHFDEDYQKWIDGGKKGKSPNPDDYGKDQKMLFAEELQSDWALSGRKQGFNIAVTKEQVAEELYHKKYSDMDEQEKNAVDYEYAGREEMGRNKIPDMPFKNNWHEFVLKNLLRKAAEEGYDKLGWTTGEQQADRYNLAKYISAIKYDKNKDGTFDLDIIGKEGESLDIPNTVNIKPEKLEEFVGKEVAKKIIENEGSESIRPTLQSLIDRGEPTGVKFISPVAKQINYWIISKDGSNLDKDIFGYTAYDDSFNAKIITKSENLTLNELKEDLGDKIVERILARENPQVNANNRFGGKIFYGWLSDLDREIKSKGSWYITFKNAEPFGTYISEEDAQKEAEQIREMINPPYTKELSGLQLKIGGQWATNLYDKVIPEFLNKYGKKWGVKVEETYIGEKASEYSGAKPKDIERLGKQSGGIYKVHSIDITPEMKRSVLYEGQAMFEAPTFFGREGADELTKYRDYKKHLELAREELAKIDAKGAEAITNYYEKYGKTPYKAMTDIDQELKKINQKIKEIQQQANQTDMFKPSTQSDDEQLKLFEKESKFEKRSKEEIDNVFGSEENRQRTIDELTENLSGPVKVVSRRGEEQVYDSGEQADIRYKPNYRSGISLPQRTVPRIVANAGIQEFDYTGRHINDIRDIADLAYVIRHPGVETHVHFGIDKDGFIVGNTALSSGASDYIIISGENVYFAAKMLKDRGAVKIISLHNHPSGDPSPSQDDISSAAYFNDLLKKELGISITDAMVINGDKFSHWKVGEIEKAGQASFSPYKNHEKHRFQKWYDGYDKAVKIDLSNSDIVADLFKEFKTGRGYATIVIADIKLKLRGWEVVPISLVRNTGEFNKYVNETLKVHGGNNIFIVGSVDELGIDLGRLFPTELPDIKKVSPAKPMFSETSRHPYTATITYKDGQSYKILEYWNAPVDNNARKLFEGSKEFGEEPAKFGEHNKRQEKMDELFNKEDRASRGFKKSINEMTKGKKISQPGQKGFRISERAKEVLKSFGIPINEKHLSRRYLGLYKLRPKSVRVQSLYDIVTVAHEVSHAIDDKYKITKTLIDNTSRGDKLRKELTDIYEDLYPTGSRNHPLEKRMIEGFATFIENYFYDPSGTASKYPGLVDNFIKPSGQYYNPDITKMLDGMNQIVEDYAKLDPWQRIASRIRDGQEVVKSSDTGFDLMQRIKFEIFNIFEPFERYSKLSGVRRSWEDPSVSAFNYLNRATIAHNWIKGDAAPVIKRDGNWDFKKETVEQYLKMTEGKDKEFDAYLVARRDLELYNRITELKNDNPDVFIDLEKAMKDNDLDALKTLLAHPAVIEAQQLENILQNDDFDLQDMQATVDSFEGEFAEPVRIYDKINQNLIDFSENTGLITSEQADKWRETKGYASFQRFINDELLDTFNRQSSNAQTNLKAKKARTGGKLDIISPVYNQILAINETIGKGLNNMIWRKVYDMSLHNTEIARRFEKIETVAAVQNGRIIFPQEKDPTLVRILVNGERVFVRPAPEFAALADAMRPMEFDLFSLLIRVPSQIFTRLTTSANPLFALRNITIDQVTLGYNTHHGSIPGISPIKNVDALYEHFMSWLRKVRTGDAKEAKGLNEYLLLGGKRQTFASEYDLAPEDLKKVITRDQTLKDRVIETIDNGISIFEIPSNFSEYASRYAEYNNALKDGKSMSEAMYAAAQATLPFQQYGRMGGQLGRQVVKSIPFFNPALLAVYRFAKAAKENPVRFATISASLMAVAFASAASIMVLCDEKDRRMLGNLSPEELSRAIFLKNPFGEGLIRVRIPEQIGALTGLIYLYVIQHYGGNKAVFNDYVRDVTSAVPSQFNIAQPGEALFAWTPQVLKPGLEVATNTRTYPNLLPIEPDWMREQLAPEDRYNDYTSYFAKKLGGWAKLSPKEIDFYVKAQFGVVGDFIMGSGDFAQGEFKKLSTTNPGLVNENVFRMMGRAYNNFYDKREFYTQQYNKLKGDHEFSDQEAERIKSTHKIYEDFAKQLTNARALDNEEKLDDDTLDLIWRTLLDIENDDTDAAAEKIDELKDIIPDKERRSAKYRSGEEMESNKSRTINRRTSRKTVRR